MPRWTAASNPREMRWAALAGLAPTALSTVGLVLSLSRPRVVDLIDGHEVGDAAMAMACGLVAAIILSRRPRHPVGRLFAVIGLADGLSMLSSGFLDVSTPSTTAWTIAQWLASWTWVPGLVLTLFGICLLVPEGISGRGMRWLWRTDITLLVAVCVCQAFAPHLQTGPHTEIDNPVGLAGLGAVGVVVHVAGLISAAASLGVLIGRMVRADGRLRLQLLPIFAASVAVLGSVIVAGPLGVVGSIMQDCCFLLLPAAALLSVLRLRLYGLEIAIGRTATWVTLSGLSIAVYVGIVELASSVLGVHGRIGSVVATVIIAILFNPSRLWLQEHIARWLYGDRGDPYRALSRTTQLLSGGADPVGALNQAVADLAHRLRSPGVRIIRDDTVLVGSGSGVPAMTVPLISAGSEVGRLEVAPRAPGEGFTAADHRLILDLCAPLSSAVAAVVLAEELRSSRERLALAREAERQRVRGELHDDVGPSLAAAAMQTQMVRRRLDRGNLIGAEQQLDRLSETILRAASDVRSAIDSLGPRVLDEVGLADAVRSLVHSGNTPPLNVDVGDLSDLPAATEAAAYRVIAEALNNARRHAQASRVLIELHQTGHQLVLAVHDDGVGGVATRSGGVGIASMRARVEEVGGQFRIGPGRRGEGTSVLASIPAPGHATS